MTPLNEADTADLLATAHQIFDVTPGLGAFFKTDDLARRRFRAAIFEGDFRDADQAVSDLCRGRHLATARCLDVDPGSVPRAFEFAPTHEHLAAVRTHYHTPSYAIIIDAPVFMIVSDSDYYWGFAGAPRLVRDVVARNAKLCQTRDDIRPFLESTTLHDRRIGAMLNAFHDVCDETAAIA